MPNPNDIVIKLKADATQLKREMKRSGEVVAKQANRMKEKALGVNTGFNKLKETFKRFRLVALAVTFAIGKVIHSFAKLERGMIDVGNLTGATSSEVRKMTRDILDLGRRTGESFQNLSKGLFDVVSAGVKASESMKFLEVASKLAVAGVTNTKVAVDGLTSIINAYELETSDALKIADKFFQAQKLGKTTIAELASTVGRLAPIAKASGLAINDLFSSLAVLTAQGISTEESVVGMRALLSTLLKPSAEAQRITEKLGIQFDIQALQAKGLTGFLIDMEKAVDGNSKTYAKLFPNIRAITPILSLVKNEAKKLAEANRELASSAGSVTRAYQAQQQSIGQQFSRVANQLKALALLSVQLFETPIKGTLGGLNNLFNAMHTGIKKILDFRGRADPFEAGDEFLSKRERIIKNWKRAKIGVFQSEDVQSIIPTIGEDTRGTTLEEATKAIQKIEKEEPIKKLADKAEETMKELNDMIYESSRSWSDSMAESLLKSENAFKSLRNIAKTIFHDIAKSLIKTQITTPFVNSLVGALGITQPEVPEAIAPRAGGGAVNRGNPYLVGENGAELFVPKISGNILNRNQMPAGGSKTVNVIQNFSVGVEDTVRARILEAVPQVVSATKNAVFEEIERGGVASRRVGRR